MSTPGDRDSVAAVFATEQLERVLSIVHRQGHGHHARVIHSAGDSFGSRIDQAGLPAAIRDVAVHLNNRSVVIVDAPHQTAQVAELLLGLGALRVERYLSPRAASTLIAFDSSLLTRRSSARARRSAPTS